MQEKRIAYLDGLRGVAIALVVGVHWLGPRVGVMTGGYIGVDVFFVLSGYVITRLLLREPMSYREFMARRARRLLPALGGLLVVGGVLMALLGDGVGAALQAALVAAAQVSSPWAAAGGTNLGVFGVTWSLAVEWYFYAAWPFVVAAIIRFRIPARWLLVAAAGLWACSLPLSGVWFYFGPTAHFAELALGGAVAFAARTGVTVSGRWLPAGWLLVGAWAVAGPVETSAGYRVALPVVAVVAAWTMLVAPVGARRVLEDPRLVSLGRVSYSLYLWHAVPLALLLGKPHDSRHLLYAVISAPLVVAGTAASYLLLELRRPVTGKRHQRQCRSSDIGFTRSEGTRR